MSRVGEELAGHRMSLGLTQTEYGRRIGAARQSVSAWERGEGRIPPDILGTIIREMRAPRLALMASAESPLTLVPVPWLDRTDTHPLAMIHQAQYHRHSAAGAGESLERLVFNRKCRDDLGEEEWAELKELMARIVENYVADSHLFVTMAEVYDWDPWEAAADAQDECYRKGYISHRRDRLAYAG